jgi:hypothetical protein
MLGRRVRGLKHNASEIAPAVPSIGSKNVFIEIKSIARNPMTARDRQIIPFCLLYGLGKHVSKPFPHEWGLQDQSEEETPVTNIDTASS